MKIDLTLEVEVQRAVVRVLETFQCHVISFRSLHAAKKTRPSQARGVPDLKVYVPQKRTAFWFECKRPGEVLSEDQRRFKLLAEQCQEAYAWGGVHEAQEQLRKIGLLVAFEP
jgi:hypothetical protein